MSEEELLKKKLEQERHRRMYSPIVNTIDNSLIPSLNKLSNSLNQLKQLMLDNIVINDKCYQEDEINELVKLVDETKSVAKKARNGARLLFTANSKNNT